MHEIVVIEQCLMTKLQLSPFSSDPTFKEQFSSINNLYIKLLECKTGQFCTTG